MNGIRRPQFTFNELESSASLIKSSTMDNVTVLATKWCINNFSNSPVTERALISPKFSAGPNNELKFRLKLTKVGITTKLRNLYEYLPEVTIEFLTNHHCENLQPLVSFLFFPTHLVVIFQIYVKVDNILCNQTESKPIFTNRFSNMNETFWYVPSESSTCVSLACKWSVSLQNAHNKRLIISPQFFETHKDSPIYNQSIQFKMSTKRNIRCYIPSCLILAYPQDWKKIYCDVTVFKRDGTFRRFSQTSNSNTIEFNSGENNKNGTDWEDYIFNDLMIHLTVYMVIFPRTHGISEIDSPPLKKIKLQKNNSEEPEEQLKIPQIVEKYTDLYFIVNDKKFGVHKHILCSTSSFFKEYFRKTPNIKEFPIENMDIENFLKIIEYMYTGHIQNFSSEVAMQILPKAQEFKILNLIEWCEKIILESLTIDNVLEMIKMARFEGLEFIKYRAIRFAAKNIVEVSKQPAYQRFLLHEPTLSLEVMRALSNTSYY